MKRSIHAQTQRYSLSHLTRRDFCRASGSLLLCSYPLLRSSRALAQAPSAAAAPSSTRPDVAAIDHDRILAAADRALTQPPTPLTSMPCPRSPGTPHDYYSEIADPNADPGVLQPLFTAHRDAIFQLGLAVPALAAAYALTSEDRYAQHAALHLRAWFIDSETKMTPAVEYSQVTATPPRARSLDAGASEPAPSPKRIAGGRFEGIIEALPIAEIAQSIPFLGASAALTDEDISGLHAWFAAYLTWLTAPQDAGPRLAALARDSKNHHATSWLLQSGACAYLQVPPGDVARAEDTALGHLRQHFRRVTLRSQFNANGTFPHELSGQTPYRDSLMNLDMMACVCQLLSTRFESVWDYQLEDGPSMRGAIAYHFPYIADRTLWPFRADAQHFDELPSRRPSLLLAARPYQRPEYAALWQKLHPDPATPDILRSIPIHQPLLWVRQPGHRA